ncbi:hypothetical protein B9Z55_000621 [Caenorhabditis nigoni]|uniref:F-box domain-containing protein n=1 Tax=Caenorhabditis nigoni TaxID=1611254 RepID=A0A2G5VUB0_9PELO|nr:hypothetical protein B9Z55_000621 [Caenorhabditis nigoni]
MILSKLPSVVQNEIFYKMEYSDLLLLSLASKNIKKLIKLSQTRRFKSIGYIVYGCTSEPYLLYIRNKHGVDFILKIAQHEEYDKYFCSIKDFQFDVSGKILDFRLCYQNQIPCPVVFFHPQEKKTVINSMHNYLFDFFGSTVEYHWKSASYYEFHIPQLRNLSACSITLGTHL